MAFFLILVFFNTICVLADEDEPSNCSGALPEKQPVNNNNKADHVATGSEEDISEDDVSEEDKNFNPLVAPGTYTYTTLIFCVIILLFVYR